MTLPEFLTLLEAMQKEGRLAFGGGVLLPRAHVPREGRESLRPLRPRVRGVLCRRERAVDALVAELPEEWLKALVESVLSEKRRQLIESLGGWEKLLETLRKRLEEQKGRHQGGNKWIGTGGTSPVRRVRLQPRRHPHRPAGFAQPARGQGVGRARVPQPRRLGRARHAQHQARAAPAAQVRARRRARRARPRRHDLLDREARGSGSI